MTIAKVFEHLALLTHREWRLSVSGAVRTPMQGLYKRDGTPFLNCPLGVLAGQHGISMETEALAEAVGIKVEDASKLIDAADNVPPMVRDKVHPFNHRLRAQMLKAVGLDDWPEAKRRKKWRCFATNCAGHQPGTPEHRAFVKLSMGEPLDCEAEIVAVASEWPTIKTYRGKRVE